MNDARDSDRLLVVGVVGFVVLLATMALLAAVVVHHFDSTANSPVGGTPYTPPPVSTATVTATPSASKTPSTSPSATQ